VTPEGAVSLTPPGAEAGAIARIPGSLFSPGPTFESIARRPTWLAPLLLWTAVSVVVTTMLLPRIDWERVTRQGLERRHQTIPEERIPAVVEQTRKIGSVVSWFFGLAGPVLASLFVAVVIWGSFKAFGWDATFRQSFGATTHAFLPNVLKALLLLPIIARRETIDPEEIGDLLRSNLGFLVERDSAKVLHALLQSVDLFALWSLILLVIGFASAAKVSKKSAAGVVIGLWVLLILLKAGWAAMF
jgi:hypothetical protein